MNNKIKPIETKYRGYLFRSRLEARWAVFFDAMRLKWRYETEGYRLPSGCYLPDFWFPTPTPTDSEHGLFVEIKPVPLTHHQQILSIQLHMMTGRNVFAFCGEVGEQDIWSTIENGVSGQVYMYPQSYTDGLTPTQQLMRFACDVEDVFNGTDDRYEWRVEDAVAAARSERFDQARQRKVPSY